MQSQSSSTDRLGALAEGDGHMPMDPVGGHQQPLQPPLPTSLVYALSYLAFSRPILEPMVGTCVLDHLMIHSLMQGILKYIDSLNHDVKER